jgi:K+-transporting ATPase ATPase A chain
MTTNAVLQFLIFVALTIALVLPLGSYISRLFADEQLRAGKPADSLEDFIYRAIGLRPQEQQTWATYAGAVVVFNAIGMAALFLILMHQNILPWNPQHLPGLSADLAFNIAASFVTNTDWQSYSGETTLSYFSQMLGLTVQNFLSAATGIAVAIATIRGFTRKEDRTIGNFYVDLTRATICLLLPLALLFCVPLLWDGVPMNMHPNLTATTIEHSSQVIAEGPVASQIAIKELGSNGGGFFGANGSHPFENPTPLTNLFQMISILVIACALVVAFGRMVGDRRQGWAILASMTILFLVLLGLCLHQEAGGNTAFSAFGIDQVTSDNNPGGNMEGKETRFGIFNSVLWTTLMSATSNGSTNASLDSFTPLGGMIPLFNMLLGEVIYGGVGSGLYGILIYVLITVFIAGLRVGRTPEYLGKKIEAFEIKLAVLAMVLYPVCVLGFGVVSLLVPDGAASIATPGPHGLTQTIYAYASAAANNGSSFAGFGANTVFQNVMLGIVILIGRFGVIIPVLAIAGSLASKKTAAPSAGTFPTHGPMFVILLTAVIIMFGGLTYFPALALGPVAEQLNTARVDAN